MNGAVVCVRGDARGKINCESEAGGRPGAEERGALVGRGSWWIRTVGCPVPVHVNIELMSSVGSRQLYRDGVALGD